MKLTVLPPTTNKQTAHANIRNGQDRNLKPQSTSSLSLVGNPAADPGSQQCIAKLSWNINYLVVLQPHPHSSPSAGLVGVSVATSSQFVDRATSAEQTWYAILLLLSNSSHFLSPACHSLLDCSICIAHSCTQQLLAKLCYAMRMCLYFQNSSRPIDASSPTHLSRE